MRNEENNKAVLTGKIISELEFDHDVFGEKFYSTLLFTERRSGNLDMIPLLISERLLDKNLNGKCVSIIGEFRSYNRHEDGKSRLLLNAFVQELSVLSTEFAEHENDIELTGYICKNPVYRKTPLGREIADLLLAVNRPYGKTDYIPCICWGRNARYVDRFETGVKLKLCGRIQSRTYTKRLSDKETEERTAYEVSVSRVEVLENEK